MTWRVRRIGRAFWASIRAHGGTSWLAIEPSRRAISTGRIAGDRIDGPARSTACEEQLVTGDAFVLLEALRLDRAACAVRTPD